MQQECDDLDERLIALSTKSSQLLQRHVQNGNPTQKQRLLHHYSNILSTLKGARETSFEAWQSLHRCLLSHNYNSADRGTKSVGILLVGMARSTNSSKEYRSNRFHNQPTLPMLLPTRMPQIDSNRSFYIDKHFL